MTYYLRNGYTVRTTRHGEVTEFETCNPAGETISTITMDRMSANHLVKKLTARAARHG